jgi:hypothetical protein
VVLKIYCSRSGYKEESPLGFAAGIFAPLAEVWSDSGEKIGRIGRRPDGDIF